MADQARGQFSESDVQAAIEAVARDLESVGGATAALRAIGTLRVGTVNQAGAGLRGVGTLNVGGSARTMPQASASLQAVATMAVGAAVHTSVSITDPVGLGDSVEYEQLSPWPPELILTLLVISILCEVGAYVLWPGIKQLLEVVNTPLRVAIGVYAFYDSKWKP